MQFDDSDLIRFGDSPTEPEASIPMYVGDNNEQPMSWGTVAWLMFTVVIGLTISWFDGGRP